MISHQRRLSLLKKRSVIKGLEARIEANLGEDLAKIANLALKPEIEKAPRSRFIIRISHYKGKLILNLSGKDISQLRAMANSYLRLIGAIIGTIQNIRLDES
jgi:tRNA threonylcarbamoyladenosine modification (KEOPS) complex  Pcc1 subunit